MGLDMFAYKTRHAIDTPVDFPSQEDDERIFQWRKHPNLHGWMEQLYRERGGVDGAFNCVNLALLPEDIDRLETDVLTYELPETSGFFFGVSRPEAQNDDLEFIRLAREAQAEGQVVYYSSWW